MSQGASKGQAQEKPKQKVSWLKIVGAVVGIAAFFIVRAMHIEGLSMDAQNLLAVLAFAVVFWITTPIPVYFTGLLASVLPWLLGFQFNIAFAGFASGTTWLFFAALGIAGGLSVSGVAKRIALVIISKVKPTFTNTMIMLFVVMFILGYVIPSGSGRTAVMLAIMVPLVVLFGVEMKSNVGKAITLAVPMLGWVGAWQVVTGGMPGLIIWGSLGQLGYEVSWVQWAIIMSVPTALLFVTMYFAIRFLWKPEASEAVGGKGKIQSDLKALGPLSGKEKNALIITGLIILMWLLEPVHHIKTDVVGIAGVLLYALPGIGVTTFDELVQKLIPWSLIIFVGALLSVATMAATSGLGVWISNTLVAPIYSFASNSFLYVIATWILNTITGATMLFIPTMALIVPPMTTAAVAAGVNPVVGALMYLSMYPQMLYYCAVPFPLFAFAYGAVEVKDWMKAGLIFWLAWPVIHILMSYTWYPLLGAIGIL